MNDIHIEERLEHVCDWGIQALSDEAQAITDLIPQIDDNFTKAVNMMYNCYGKIIVTGVGKSGNIGAKIAATLASTGTPAFFISPLDVYHPGLQSPHTQTAQQDLGGRTTFQIQKK